MKLRTKIIATSGPSLCTQKDIEAAVLAGVSIIRINGSHGNPKAFQKVATVVRKVEKKLKTPVGLMLDLQGPKLRVGVLDPALQLKRSEVWELSATKKASQDDKIINIAFKGLSKSVSLKGRLFMDDGLIRTTVVKIEKGSVFIRVDHGGELKSRKGINIPYFQGSLPAITEKDKIDLKWGLDHKVDFIALSFVRHPKDLDALRKIVKQHPSKMEPLLIAKIEKPEAVDHLNAIIDKSDGVLIARGDLGIELNLQKVPVIQKQIIDQCRHTKTPVIVATQMLDSMRYKPIPTRAEVSDVAGSIYAGTDAVMLTGETSAGEYPLRTIEMMANIIQEVEDYNIQKLFRKKPEDFSVQNHKEAFMFHVMQLASDISAKAIVMLTKRGTLTQLLSKLHPKRPIYSLAANEVAYRKLTLYWGVFPIETKMKLAPKRIEEGMRFLKRKKIVKTGDRLIFVYWDFKVDNLNMKIVEC